MSHTSLRIHPAIGIARVGNSEEYYLGPESMAGMDVPGKDVKGGLPIRPGTEDITITSDDLRDGQGRLKRQAARFRIYQYEFAQDDSLDVYPNGKGVEVRIGSQVEGKKVIDIIWTVHLANKKANSWEAESGIDPFKEKKLPPVRNPKFGADLAAAERIRKLVIDAGPRAIAASSGAVCHFDVATPACHGNREALAISILPHYPVTFPASADTRGIQSLGAIRCESGGRLVVLGGYGKACGFDLAGNFASQAVLHDDVNNDFWLDDTADGPVTAFLLLEDGSTRQVEGNAWVISTDPAYAPQTPNIVTLWDEVLCTWVENMQLLPEVYGDGDYRLDYDANFANDVYPVFRATSLQMWATCLPPKALRMHYAVGKITATWKQFLIMNYIRNPNLGDASDKRTDLMPLSLGDVTKAFLSPTKTQYFFLKQWSGRHFQDEESGTVVLNQGLGPGEVLDKTILFNCLGGRFSPGIEMSFPVRDVNLYRQNWQRREDGGPFRINARLLDYSTACRSTPFLTAGYTPLSGTPVEPGDMCKFMALPWHTDYNSCATHLPKPNPGGDLALNSNRTADASQMAQLKQDWNQHNPSFHTVLYSSWPAQRPVAVYTYDDVAALYAADPGAAASNRLPPARYSVRGEGTNAGPAVRGGDSNWEYTLAAANVGRYQDRLGFVNNWHKIGVVLQVAAIVNRPGAPAISPDFFLETESRFEGDHSNLVEPWRNTLIDHLYQPQ